MTDLSTYDILNDIRNGKTPVKRQNPQPGESPYYYIQSNGDKSYLPITEKNIIDVNSADEPNPLWCSAFQKTTNTGSNEATQTSVADLVLSGTFDTFQTDGLGTNSTQTDNLGFNSVSSTNNTTSLFDTPQTTPFSTSQTTSFGSASSETTPMTPFEATQTTPLGSSTLGTFSSDSSSYGINPTSSTVPFNTNNSSFSETLNQYFSSNMPTEQSYLSTAQIQNTMNVDLKTNTIEEENLLNSLDKSKVDYRYVDTFDEYLAQTPPELRPHLVNSYPSNRLNLKRFVTNNKPFVNDIIAINALLKNYLLMQDTKNRPGNDNYMHRRAQIEAAQWGKNASEKALFLGELKEDFDLYRKGNTEANRLDGIKDMKNNLDGAKAGWMYPDVPADEILKDFDDKKNQWRVPIR